MVDLREIVNGGDAVIELREAADQFADVDILRPVDRSEAGQDVSEIVLLCARRPGAVVD